VKTRPFLRDIDDVHHYANTLENVHALLYEELGEILAKFPLLLASDVVNDWFRCDGDRLTDTYSDLARLRHTMSLLMRDMLERKKRLADIAVGLPDVKFDE